MPKQILTTIILLMVLLKASSQTRFIANGKIEFEKKTNMYKQIELIETDDSWRSTIKKSVPNYKVSYFDLYFDKNKTLYKPGREVVATQKSAEWIEGPAVDNIVFTDLDQKIYSSQKTVFDDIFNIQDTVRKANWKITSDTRTIAGFDCRKATTIIMDSVFVVAFYTDQIVTPGGPESFVGLPGMILGLAIPRLNTTWFATKLETVEVNAATLAPPKKGKKTNVINLKGQLKSSMKDWGKMGDRNIWQILI